MKRRMRSIFIIIVLLAILSGCGYLNSSSPVSLLSSCSLDGIEGATSTSPGNFSTSVTPPDLITRGWIANNLAGTSPDKITVVIADDLGKIIISKNGSGFSRPDVAEFHKKPNMRDSGFEILMGNPTKPGIYTVTIQGVFDGDTLVCASVYKLTVTN